MSNKYIQVSDAIKNRILNGDYALTSFPSERKLAADGAVSYATARRAIQHLIEENVLQRKANGRLEVNSNYFNAHKQMKIAYIKGNWAFPSNPWEGDLKQAADVSSASLKIITFDHKDDPAISDALDGDFDLIVLMPFPYTETTLRKLEKKKDKVLTLFIDHTERGIPMLGNSIKQEVSIAIEHLKEIGHEKIAFFYLANLDNVIQSRLDFYKESVQQVETICYEAKPFENPSPHIREQVKTLIKSGELNSTAILCSAMFEAFSVARGVHESGLTIGQDIAISTLGNWESGQNFIPSITTTRLPSIKPVFLDIINNIKTDNFGTNLQYNAGQAELVPGESTARMKSY